MRCVQGSRKVALYQIEGKDVEERGISIQKILFVKYLIPVSDHPGKFECPCKSGNRGESSFQLWSHLGAGLSKSAYCATITVFHGNADNPVCIFMEPVITRFTPDI